MQEKVIVIGAGGHGKCVAEALRLSGDIEVAGFVDPIVSGEAAGVRVIGSDIDLVRLAGTGIRRFVVGVGRRGGGTWRSDGVSLPEALWSAAVRAGMLPCNAIHPSAVVSEYAKIGLGVYVGPLAVVNADATLLDGCVIGSQAVVEHDCSVGDYAFVGPGAVICGNARVCRHAFVGASATVLPGMQVGRCATVAAGAVVTRAVLAEELVVGIPARRADKT